MARQWFIKTKAGPQGPVSVDTLAKLADAGKLKPNSPVSRDRQSWIKAKHVSGLTFAESPSDKSSRPAEETWFVLAKHSIVGPLSLRKLQRLASRGRIEENVAVSRDRKNWIKAIEVPGLVFPQASPRSEEQSKNTTSEVAQSAAKPQPVRLRQLYLPIQFDHLIQHTPQQLSLFDIALKSRHLNPAPTKSDDDYPLLRWPADSWQLRLFDTEYDGRRQVSSNTSNALRPARQLRLLKQDEPISLEQLRTIRPRQLTLFAGVLPESIGTACRRPTSTSALPLFCWTSAPHQLRLFTTDGGQSTTGDSSDQLPRQLWFADLTCRIRLRQLTLFAGVTCESIVTTKLPKVTVDALPLFFWRSQPQQLRLFSGDGAEQTNLPEDLDCPRQLWMDELFGIEINLPIRQRTLFVAVGSEAIVTSDRPTVPLDAQPLFFWRSRPHQLRLFTGNGDADTSWQEGLDEYPRQLWLNEMFEEQTEAELPMRQLTLFAVDQPCKSDIDRQAPPRLAGYPLFGWQLRGHQLRLFDPSADDRGSARVSDGAATVESACVEANGDQAASAMAESSTHDLVTDPATLPRQPSANETRHWDRLRKAAYAQRFGRYSHVARPTDPTGDPVDVHVFPADHQRPITTLVTSGMSNCAMPVPSGRCSPRAELVLYVDHVEAEYVNLLYLLAQFPLQQNGSLYYGATLGHGDPPRAILPHSELDGYVFLIPSVDSDFRIHETTMIDDDPLQLLWVVPTTTAERTFLAKHGMRHFCALLDQFRHPLVFDPRRPCYIRAGNVAG